MSVPGLKGLPRGLWENEQSLGKQKWDDDENANYMVISPLLSSSSISNIFFAPPPPKEKPKNKRNQSFPRARAVFSSMSGHLDGGSTLFVHSQDPINAMTSLSLSCRFTTRSLLLPTAASASTPATSTATTTTSSAASTGQKSPGSSTQPAATAPQPGRPGEDCAD